MDVSAWFFDGWQPLFKTALVGIAIYVSLVVLLRVSGKRTLSKMNAFDFVITVALGSILAATLTGSSMTYARGMTAFALLVGLQYLVTWLAVRSDSFADLIKGDPTILYYKGRYFREAMLRERVPEGEILNAIRQSGQGAPAEIAAVLLESNGELIVMNEVADDQTVTLQEAQNWPEVQRRGGERDVPDAA